MSKSVSIPKGAIMSAGIALTYSTCTCFNSKRCDYERIYWRARPSLFGVSIPKGAIMRKLAASTWNLPHCFNSKRCDYERATVARLEVWILRFNSKRCDYEEFPLSKLFCNQPVSIPKGAIMSTKRKSGKQINRRFNSKRCDYERRSTLTLTIA